jgi:hypothetical protein
MACLDSIFLRGTDLSVHSHAHLNKVARQLNERPRETLQFETQQRDLTPVLHRPVEPAPQERTYTEMCSSARVLPWKPC